MPEIGASATRANGKVVAVDRELDDPALQDGGDAGSTVCSHDIAGSVTDRQAVSCPIEAGDGDGEQKPEDHEGQDQLWQGSAALHKGARYRHRPGETAPIYRLRLLKIARPCLRALGGPY